LRSYFKLRFLFQALLFFGCCLLGVGVQGAVPGIGFRARVEFSALSGRQRRSHWRERLRLERVGIGHVLLERKVERESRAQKKSNKFCRNSGFENSKNQQEKAMWSKIA